LKFVFDFLVCCKLTLLSLDNSVIGLVKHLNGLT
jgi:hypothetical protein